MWNHAAALLAQNGSDQWQYPVKLHNIYAAIDSRTLWLATDHKGLLVATITVDQHADPALWFPEDHPDDALYLHRMITNQSARGNEIGSALIDWASRLAVRNKLKWIRLDAWRSNRALWKYYTDRKFELVRVVDDPSGSGACFQRDATIQLGLGPTVREATMPPIV